MHERNWGRGYEELDLQYPLMVEEIWEAGEGVAVKGLGDCDDEAHSAVVAEGNLPRIRVKVTVEITRTIRDGETKFS
jgi:hypothetical protein